MFSVMLIKISPRNTLAPKVQELLTNYGCSIKTRLGIHEATSNICSQSGLIILDLLRDNLKETEELKDKLNSLEGVSAKLVEI